MHDPLAGEGRAQQAICRGRQALRGRTKLSEEEPTFVGTNHGFSFPISYFEKHGLAFDWPEFL